MNFNTLSTALKKVFVVTKRNITKYKNSHKRQLFLSFGENCLTDDILARFGVKSFSTPYSSGRSNVEYILQIEKDNFSDFLNPAFMKYCELDGKQVVRLTKYDKIENQYAPLQINGFEFTHHDVLGDEKQREKIGKRANRMLNLKNKEVNIFYHNRYTENTNQDLLLTHLSELKDLYQKRCKAVNVFLFTQRIVSNIAERKVDCETKQGINIYTFHVMNIWQGDDAEIFWARCDNDLLKKMIDDAKKKTKRNRS